MLNDMNYLTNGCQNFNENNNLTSLEKDYESSKNNILLTSKPTIRKKYLAAKSIGKIEIIHFEDILWLHASSNYIEVHLKDKVVLHRESLTKLEEILPKNQFLRVHRSSIVNICVIKNIHSDLGRYNLISLTNGDKVKLSNAYRQPLFQQLGIDD